MPGPSGDGRARYGFMLISGITSIDMFQDGVAFGISGNKHSLKQVFIKRVCDLRWKHCTDDNMILATLRNNENILGVYDTLAHYSTPPITGAGCPGILLRRSAFCFDCIVLLEIRHVHLHRMEFCPQQWGHGGPQEPAGLDMALADADFDPGCSCGRPPPTSSGYRRKLLN